MFLSVSVMRQEDGGLLLGWWSYLDPSTLVGCFLLAAGTSGQPGGRTLSGASPWLSVPLYTQASSLETRAETVTEHSSLSPCRSLWTHTHVCAPSSWTLRTMVDMNGTPCSCAGVGACVQIWLHLIQCNQPCVFFPIRVFVSLWKLNSSL